MKKLFAAIFLLISVSFISSVAAASVKVSFKIDMKDAKIKDPKSVGISGDVEPLSWKKLYLLTDPDNDGIYTGDIIFNDANKVEFKFRHDDIWERGDNRSVILKEKTSEIVTEIWNVQAFVGFFNYTFEGKIIPMQERMRLGEQPANGISLCVMRDGKLDTLANWGERDAEKKLPMDAKTIFQTGGIGQPIIAFAVLRAAELKDVDLDKPINNYLKKWKFPLKKGENESKTTIRDIIIGNVSFGSKSKPDGYETGKALPNIVQILNGESPSQESKLKIVETPNFSFYVPLILQVLLEDAYNLPLNDVMQKLVLAPLSMKESFYATELSDAQKTNFAVGYNKNGKAVKGDYLRYPEQGFGGLWTTAADYAKVVNCLVKAARGEENSLISQALAKAALEPTNGQRPMVFPRNDNGQNYFGGAPQGYRTQVEFSVEENWIAVAFMNSWENWRFMLQVQAKAQEFATRRK